MNEQDTTIFSTKRWLQFFLVGLFPWVTVNSVFAELPVFNRYVPEGKKLSSEAGLACQIANISLVYVYLRQKFQDKFITLETTVIWLLFLTFVSCLALSLFWNFTIGGHSVVILTCTFTGGIVGILSIVTLYPWASSFNQPKAISALSTGTAASSLIGALLGLIQGAGEKTQRFSPSVYMFILSLLSILSAYCFYVLNSTHENAAKHENNSNVDTKKLLITPNSSRDEISTQTLLTSVVDEEDGGGKGARNDLNWRILITYIIAPVTVQFLNCALNYALLPGIIPYLSCGHILTFWFTLLISFSNVFGRFVSTFYQTNSSGSLPCLISIMVCLFICAFALANGNASTKKNGITQILAGVGVAVFAALNGYIESLVFLVPSLILKDESETSKELGLQFVGMIGQVGAFIGTVTTAALVSESDFHQC
jgi:hypothetical protein